MVSILPVKSQKKQKPRPNCSIYISNLPLDVKVEEIEEIFSKYGVIAKDSITGR